MKKILVMTILLSSLMIGCGNDETEIENNNLDKVNSQIDYSNENVDLTSDYFKEISAQKFQEMVNSGENYFFFVGRDTCPACKSFKPIAMQYAKENKFNIYYVNSTDFEKSDWNIIDEIATIEYIPTILIVKDKQVLYNEHGVKSYDIVDSLVEQYMN